MQEGLAKELAGQVRDFAVLVVQEVLAHDDVPQSESKGMAEIRFVASRSMLGVSAYQERRPEVSMQQLQAKVAIGRLRAAGAEPTRPQSMEV